MSSRGFKSFPLRHRPVSSCDDGSDFPAPEKLPPGSPLLTGVRGFQEYSRDDEIRAGPLGLNQLNHPTEPLVELVFVHGLGGGSRKSWSKSAVETQFWPKSWLPCDPDFRHVRIYSFGYKSTKTEVYKGICGIPDYAKSFLSALRDSPTIRRNENAIILVGHSMGGLVIKKAFIQAHAIEIFKPLAARMRSLYFLGTPHQGSDAIGAYVSYFRGVPFISTTENIKDLDPSSRIIEAMNQEFPRCSQDIEIRSYWEAQASKFLLRRQYVVPKQSACLNYLNETSDGIDADHRDICKFERPEDPNFQKLRNALAASVETLIVRNAAQNQASYSEDSRLLREYLGIDEPPEDDLADHLSACLTDDTCAWFTKRQDFQNWRDLARDDVDSEERLKDFILMIGEPGAGKSVLSAQIVRDLQALRLNCSYYFFDAQDHDKSSVNRLLRSLAFQMAMLCSSVRYNILELRKQNLAVINADEKLIWRRLFINCIFRVHSGKQHFWIIDGLDECPQSANLLAMLSKLTADSRSKIFVTTRADSVVHEDILVDQSRVSHMHLSKTDTQESIKTYAETRVSWLRLVKEPERHALVRALLDAADGSFLWVKLTLNNISKATGPQQIQEFLSQIPNGIDDLYFRSLKNLEQDLLPCQIPVVKNILDWTMCANPHLTPEELEAAIKLDTNSEVFLTKICKLLCNLIYIDRSGKIRPIHQTVQTYLFKPDLDSPFAISSSDTHSRIANRLIGHLNQRLRNVRGFSQLNTWHQGKEGIDEYALFYFSDHIRKAVALDHGLLMEIDQFLSRRGISWISCIAKAGVLFPIIKASQNLHVWLQACNEHIPAMGELVSTAARVQQWSIDLTRLIAIFGRHLLDCPSAVYMLVPPFVPRESVLAVSRPRPREISIVGPKSDVWDDRLCSKFYQISICSVVASGKDSFAIAMKSGTVYVYDNNTLELLRTLNHGAMVKLLKYNEAGTYLLTASFSKMMMWETRGGRLLWEQVTRGRRLAAEFIQPDILISISSRHELIKQDIASGIPLSVTQRRVNTVEDDGSSGIFRRDLQYAEFSKDAEMLATMQRERPVQLTDIEDRYEVGTIELELSEDGDYSTIERPTTAMTFCANTDIALLAAIYRDGTLATFDRDLRLLSKRADTQGSTLLTGSPNGLLLAVASVQGMIMLFKFRDLTLLHTLYTNSIENIRSLVFSGDGQRMIEIRDRQVNIWAPTILISHAPDEFGGISKSVIKPGSIINKVADRQDGMLEITCITPCPKTDHFFVGREDGSVAVYNIKGAILKVLFKDPGKQWTTTLTWKPNGRLLTSLNGASSVAIHFLAIDWTVSTVFRHTFPEPIKQTFVDEKNENLKIFVVTTKTVDLWTVGNIKGRYQTSLRKQLYEFSSGGRWFEDPSGDLIFAEPSKVSKFCWDDWKMEDPTRELGFPCMQTRDMTETAQHYQDNDRRILGIDCGTWISSGGRPKLFFRSMSSYKTITMSTSAAIPKESFRRQRWTVDVSSMVAPSAHLEEGEEQHTSNPPLFASLLPVSDMIAHVIGIRNDGKQLLFLDKKLWVCSYDLVPDSATRLPSVDSQDPNQLPMEYHRHFFIPDDWLSNYYSNLHSQLLFVIAGAREDCLVFAKKHEIAVIKNPFAYTEKMSVK